jgi:hypothetical protein
MPLVPNGTGPVGDRGSNSLDELQQSHGAYVRSTTPVYPPPPKPCPSRNAPAYAACPQRPQGQPR